MPTPTPKVSTKWDKMVCPKWVAKSVIIAATIADLIYGGIAANSSSKASGAAIWLVIIMLVAMWSRANKRIARWTATSFLVVICALVMFSEDEALRSGSEQIIIFSFFFLNIAAIWAGPFTPNLLDKPVYERVQSSGPLTYSYSENCTSCGQSVTADFDSPDGEAEYQIVRCANCKSLNMLCRDVPDSENRKLHMVFAVLDAEDTEQRSRKGRAKSEGEIESRWKELWTPTQNLLDNAD